MSPIPVASVPGLTLEQRSSFSSFFPKKNETDKSKSGGRMTKERDKEVEGFQRREEVEFGEEEKEEEKEGVVEEECEIKSKVE